MNTENIKGEVRKIRLRHVVIACAAVVLAFGLLGSVLFTLGGGWSDGVNFGGSPGQIFGPGKTYDVDETQALDLSGITAVNISGVSDIVEMATGEGQAHLKASCTSSGDPVKLQVQRSGSTLNVKVVYPIVSISIRNMNSRLTVNLPASYAGALKINTVSGRVLANSMPQELTAVQLSTVSGEVEFSSAAQQQLKVNTTSGGINATGITGEATFGTVSGDVKADFAAGISANVSTTSGSVDLSYAVAPGAIQVNTVSGRVNLTLPADASCDVRFNTVSGDLRSSHSGLPVERAKRGFEGRLGDGAQPLRVNTTSGNLNISQQ